MKKLGHNKTVIMITAGLLLVAAAFFYTLSGEAEKYKAGISPAIEIEQTWKLPSLLKEVSGFTFLEPDKIAAVQDETGSIYIYNLKTSSIEQEIKFSGKGDFEGIAIVGDTAYVLESNGTIYKIEDFVGAEKVKTINTFFTSKNDLEGLFYDQDQNRLLLAVKAGDPNSEDQKGIYAFDLDSEQVGKTPVYKLNLKEDIFKETETDDMGTFFPSEVAVDPSTKEILILEGRQPRLLILDTSGVPKSIHRLNPEDFPQPEGTAFDASGNLYISNEGQPATIHRITINQN